jgi:flagellar biosynthesis GTPase FlhF
MLTTKEEKNLTAEDKNFASRDKRARGLAAMGLVTRAGDRFHVATPSLRGRGTHYEVWRDAAGRVRCSCLEFEENQTEDASYRCEHILAVKHSLRAKNTEAATKQVSSAPASTVEPSTVEAAQTPKHNTSASEKREREARFGRERNEKHEQPNADADASLAQNENQKEHEMKNQKFNQAKQTNANAASFAFEAEREFNETAHTEGEETMNHQHSNNNAPTVVPFAFVNTLKQLRQPIDPKFVKTREGWTDRSGNRHLVEYVEWHTVADLLDRVCPTWSHAVRDIKQLGETVAVIAAITIDGVTREGIGTGRADSETGIKKAEHDALKRAAVKFGIARELYQRESEVIESDGAVATTSFGDARELPKDPVAKSLNDLVTPKQLAMIRALGREAGIDTEEACQALLDCRTDELSKRAASSFIDHLKEMSQEAASAGVRRAS